MDLLILALLSGYIFYRLWSVLGTRTGVERQRKLILEEEDNIIVMPKRLEPETTHQDRLVQEIVKHDPDFDVDYFLEGAEAAYRLITKAFVDGKKSKLRTFLADEPYNAFCQAIDLREADGFRLEAEIVSFENVEIDSVQVREDGNRIIGQITVMFKSKQIHVTYDKNDQIVDNEAKIEKFRQDLWTLEKQLNSDSVIWILTKTR